MNRPIDPEPPHILSLLVGIACLCACAVVCSMAITYTACRARVEAEHSARLAWEQVNELRATIAIMQDGQIIEEF